MATYDKNQIIYSINTEFEKLRQTIKAEFDRRLSGKGDDSLSDFSKYNNIKNEINDETQNQTINIDKAINSINALAGMKMTGDIINEISQYDIIPELNQYYTIVNTLSQKTDSSDHGCNAACSGFCYNSCGKTTYGSTGSASHDNGGSQGYQSGCSGCGSGCTITCGNNSCYSSTAPDICSTCAGSCHSGCINGCSGCGDGCHGCGTTCTGSCRGCHGCSGCGGCDGECGGGCATGCYNGCKNGCGIACSGTCQYGCTDQTANPT